MLLMWMEFMKRFQIDGMHLLPWKKALETKYINFLIFNSTIS